VTGQACTRGGPLPYVLMLATASWTTSWMWSVLTLELRVLTDSVHEAPSTGGELKFPQYCWGLGHPIRGCGLLGNRCHTSRSASRTSP
jgi:hypothetical protein